jgi:uncharacterized Zn-binding protein involved in type VI secretion
MPGFLFHVGAAAICPHGGQVSTLSSNTRVLVSGQPVATLSDASPIAGCAFTVPTGKPQPCVTVQWLTPATRVQINGQPVILQTSTALCQSAEQIPQGAPIITATQTRVIGA